MNYAEDLKRHYAEVHQRLWGHKKVNAVPKSAMESSGLAPHNAASAIGGLSGPTGLEIPTVNIAITFEPSNQQGNISPTNYMKIATAVARAYHISLDTLLSRPCPRHVTAMRQHLWWLCHNEYKATTTAIGRAAGYDHSTILYGVALHSKRLEKAGGNLRLAPSAP